MAESLKFLPPSQLGRVKLLARDLSPDSPSFAAQRVATAFATAIPLAVILEGGNRETGCAQLPGKRLVLRHFVLA